MCKYPYAQLVIPASFAECFTYEMQIAWLKKQIDNISSGGNGDTIDELEKKVTKLEKSVNQLSKDVANIDLDTINNEITQIKNQLSELDNKFINYATKTDLTNYVTNDKLIETTNNYLTISDANSNYAKKTDLNDYVNNTTLENYVTTTKADETYAKKTDIPDTSDLATKSELESYAKKTDIPDISDLATKSELESYAKKTDIPDISDLATKSELSNYVTKTKADVDYVSKATYHTDKMNVYTKTQINDNFYNKEEADDKFQLKSETPTDALTKEDADKLYAKISDIPDVSKLATKVELATGLNEKVSVDTFDSTVSTLATKENLNDYATKSEIPDVSEYVTNTQLSTTLEEYATKSEIPENLTVDDVVSANSQNPVSSKAVNDFVINETAGFVDNQMLSAKQDKLTFDNVPTIDSSNPVTSDGIYNAINNSVSDKLTKTQADDYYATKSQLSDFVTINTLDNYVTKANADETYAKKTDIPDTSDLATKTELESYAKKTDIPNTSDLATKSELNDKQDKLTFDNTPTLNSQNPVTSNGVYEAITNIGGGNNLDTTLIAEDSFFTAEIQTDDSYENLSSKCYIPKYMHDQNFGYGFGNFDVSNLSIPSNADMKINITSGAKNSTFAYYITSAFLRTDDSYIQLSEVSRKNIVNNRQEVIFHCMNAESLTVNSYLYVMFNFCNLNTLQNN